MKTALRYLFDPAVQLMNRLSYPRKFAAAGMLFALPLVFVTSQYIAMLNERVEISQRELAGNRVVRLMVPLWSVLCEHRQLVSGVDAPRHDALAELDRRFREKLEFRLDAVTSADEGCVRLLASSARWASFQSKVRSLLKLATTNDPALSEGPLLTELIVDLTTVFRQLADVSNLSSDSQLESQYLALATTRLLPELVEAESQLREIVLAAAPVNEEGDGSRIELEPAQALVGFRMLFTQVRQTVQRVMQRDADLGLSLQRPLADFRASLDTAQRIMGENLNRPVEAHGLSEVEDVHAAAVHNMFALQMSCLDAFDVLVGRRTEAARFRRMYLIFTALLPVVLAIYLGIGFCLAVIRTVDRMRDVTDRALANDWQGNETVPVEAQDELGHMIADFGRLTVRLREEWAAANAEAARASAAEESLRISEQRFALALRGTNDGIWDWDLHTDRVFYSTRFKELLGYGDGEFGVWLSALADVLHPDDFDDTWSAVERHLHERVPYHIEHRLRTKSGEYRWFLERGQAVWDEDGNAVRMAGSISDINERRIIEAHERIRNSVMEALAAGTPLAEILDVLVRGLEKESPTRVISILLLDREGRHLLTGAAPSLPEFYTSAINGVEIGPGVGSCGTAAYLRERVIVEDIQQHPYWASYKELAASAGLAACWSLPIFGESGKVLGTFAIYDTKVGCPSEADLDFIQAAVQVAGLAIERKQADEERRQYLMQVETSRDRIAEQSVELIQQSEELARARDEAEAAARAKSEFLANMSHELRTPLTAILGYADLLYDECDLSRVPQKSLETIDVIRSNGRHLQELIDDILDLSKIEAGRMTLEKLQVSPIKLAQDVLRLMQLRARERNLTLRCEILYPLPDKIATDALRVRQVLVNLVGNAIKFTEVGEVTVTIGYDRAVGSLRFSVTDTGIGMEPEQVDRLFAPFTQADTSMSRRFGGTGLGLSISRRLAHMLGGNIRVESQRGVGSTFTLEIAAEFYPDTVLLTDAPQPTGERLVVPQTLAKPAANLSGRILLAEDVIANQKLISFLLQKNGAEVEVVENGRLAVDQALAAQQAGTPFDLILMDIQMPVMDGYAATSTLREAGYCGRIVALTAHATGDDRQRCLDSGFDGFAVKPIQKEQLFATCREHLGLTHLQPT